MPRILADAPDLAVSQDGNWAAVLFGNRLCLYDLRSAPQPVITEAAPVDNAVPPPDLGRTEAGVELKRPEGSGRIHFLDDELLLHVYSTPPSSEEQRSPEITAELLLTPDLKPAGPLARVAGAQRIIGIGPAGAVIAPQGAGADILHVRGGELRLQRTFLRGEVLSAIPAPERRFLLEQRNGFDLWDPSTRKALFRLVLQTRRQPIQVGFVTGGRTLFAVASGPPAHIELFRASDGRPVFEMSQPGLGLAADIAPGRLVIAVEQSAGVVFLDLDLGSGPQQRLPLPPGAGKLLSFAIRPTPSTPELLALTDTSESLLRMNLARTQKSASLPAAERDSQIGRAAAMVKRDGRPQSRARPSEPQPADRTARLRQQRPESRLIRRPLPPGEVSARTEEAVAPAPIPPPPVAPLSAAPLPLVPETEAVPPPPSPAPSSQSASLTAPTARAVEPLPPAAPPEPGLAAWQWELLRWAQSLLAGLEAGVAPQPPEGGPTAKLGRRLRLSPAAQKVVALLYATEYLLGERPKGMRPSELLSCLSSLHEEPQLLAELLPTAPLRTLAVIGARPDGRLRLSREAAGVLLELPRPDFIPPAATERELLAPGIYSFLGPFRRGTALLLPQPVLPVDALTENNLAAVVKRVLARALFHEAVVLIDGLPGLSYPIFGASAVLPSLRPLLRSAKVPVVLCAMPETVPALGLSARPLPSRGTHIAATTPAPLIPSAPLPGGTSWRSPVPPTPAAFLPVGPGGFRGGRLELHTADDRRAAIIVGRHTPPEAYASAAFLAARDGAVLMIDAELTEARAGLLSLLLRQLPLTVTALPQDGPGTPWPTALTPFAQ